MSDEQLIVKQTATGYWVVQQGPVERSGGLTREAAEAERELMQRLRRRSDELHPTARRRPRRAARAPHGDARDHR